MLRASTILPLLALQAIEINTAGGAEINIGLLQALNSGLAPLLNREPTPNEETAIRNLIGQLFEAPTSSAVAGEPESEAATGEAITDPVAVEALTDPVAEEALTDIVMPISEA